MPLNIHLLVVFKELITKTFSSILICFCNGLSLSTIINVPGRGYTSLTGVVQNFTVQLTFILWLESSKLYRATDASSFLGKLIRPCNKQVCTAVSGYTEKYSTLFSQSGFIKRYTVVIDIMQRKNKYYSKM
jgi:hypothetical protein